MKNIGIVSYNINCNFTNYGSALQSWALSTCIARLGYRPVLIDYCPDILREADPLNPFKKMWDQDAESRRMCELTMPAIRENYRKFEDFYTNRFNRTAKKYTSEDLDSVVSDEKLDGFVCGSDTIFCIDEFQGLENGYYANYSSMKGRSVAYAASFGDSHFDDESYKLLNQRLGNFKAIGLRENLWVPYCSAHSNILIEKVIDPTLLLTRKDYDGIAQPYTAKNPYVLMYSRRYNRKMEAYTERLAKEKDLQVIEISLRATNAEKGHDMRYDAGVEEFLSLVSGAEVVVTNSFHGLIFAVQYSKPLVVFSREQADSKIGEVLDLFGMKGCLFSRTEEACIRDIDYDATHARVEFARDASLRFLKSELEML